MFEAPEKSRSVDLWKSLVLGVVAVAIVVTGLIALLMTGDSTKAELAGVIRAGDPTFDWYRGYLKLEDPKIQMGKSFTGSRVVMFSAIIRNGGEKMVDVVEVELSFFNYDELVWKTVRTPIRPEPRNYTPAIEPLEERGFTLYLEEIPKKWQATNAELDIFGFRFTSPGSRER